MCSFTPWYLLIVRKVGVHFHIFPFEYFASKYRCRLLLKGKTKIFYFPVSLCHKMFVAWWPLWLLDIFTFHQLQYLSLIDNLHQRHQVFTYKYHRIQVRKRKMWVTFPITQLLRFYYRLISLSATDLVHTGIWNTFVSDESKLFRFLIFSTNSWYHKSEDS